MVEQSSVFVLAQKVLSKWGPVMKMTLDIVNVLIHAVASALGVGPLIAGLTMSEHQELLGVVKTDFDDAVLEIERYISPTF